MDKTEATNLTLILSIVAAALASAATVVGHLKNVDVNISLIAASIFVLAFELTARSRTNSNLKLVRR